MGEWFANPSMLNEAWRLRRRSVARPLEEGPAPNNALQRTPSRPLHTQGPRRQGTPLRLIVRRRGGAHRAFAGESHNDD
jgi:hypothetical protein